MYQFFRRGIVVPYDFGGVYTYIITGGFTAVGFSIAVISLIALTNSRFFKKRYVAESDDRNIQISHKSWTWTAYVTFYAVLVATFFMPSMVVKYVLCLMCIPLAVYWVVNRILRIKT